MIIAEMICKYLSGIEKGHITCVDKIFTIGIRIGIRCVECFTKEYVAAADVFFRKRVTRVPNNDIVINSTAA